MHVLNTTLPAHLSLFACLDFLRAAHHHVVVVSFWWQRTFRLIGLPLLSTCARMFNSTSLAVSHCLRTSTFASCRWTRLGSMFCAWDQTSSVESACDVGDWGPRLRHSPVRPHESQELDARSTDAQPWAGESAQGMDGLRRAGTGLRCFLLNLVFTRNMTSGPMDRTGRDPRWIEPRDACNIET